MMMLEKALPLTSRTGPFVRVWQQYWTENIVDMSLSAMAELRALRNYGLDLIKRTTSASQGNPEIKTDPQSSRRRYITTNLSQSSTADCPTWETLRIRSSGAAGQYWIRHQTDQTYTLMRIPTLPMSWLEVSKRLDSLSREVLVESLRCAQSNADAIDIRYKLPVCRSRAQ